MRTWRRFAIASTSLLWLAACKSGGGERFVVRGSEVVRDGRTGLEWTRRDGGAGLDWPAAEAHCRSLAIEGAGGWRLPMIEELRSLYGEKTKTPCGDDEGCAIDPVFTLTSPWVWSATAPGTGTRTYLDFRFGTQLSPTITPRLLRRVLCVRTAGVRG